jgi:hypothetical protein
MSNTQLSASFYTVVVTSRLQFTTTEGCRDTFDQIVYLFTYFVTYLRRYLRICLFGPDVLDLKFENKIRKPCVVSVQTKQNSQ